MAGIIETGIVKTPVNELFARGVIRRFKTEHGGRFTFELVVAGRRSTSILNIRTSPSVTEGLTSGDHVVVFGYVNGFRVYNERLQKKSEVINLEATEVLKDEGELMQRFGIETGRLYQEPECMAMVSGKLIQVVPPQTGKWAKLVLETCCGGDEIRPARLPLRYYAGSWLPPFDYLVGDRVAVKLSCYSEKKQYSGGREFTYSDLVVEDIAYLERQPGERKNRSLTADQLRLWRLGKGLLAAREREKHEAEKARNAREQEANKPVEEGIPEDVIYADDSSLMDGSWDD